jgi:DNA-binding response OmpR family regulator
MPKPQTRLLAGKRDNPAEQGILPLHPDARPILIIEDSEAVAVAVAEALRRDAWRTEIASTLAEAARRIVTDRPFLLIVDRRMPDGDGVQFVRQIGVREDRGVIVTTGDADEVDRIVALEVGADVFIPKPFSPRELTATVRAIARRIATAKAAAADPAALAAPEDDAVARFGSVAIDVRRMMIAADDGRVIRLTGSEAAFLEILLDAAGEPVERERLAREVLGVTRWMPTQRGVDQLACLLRRKLVAITNGAAALLPVRGRGYRLVI